MAAICNILKWLGLAILASTYKSLPGAYFLRFYYYVIRDILIPQISGKQSKTITQLQKDKFGCFAYTTLSTYASLFECDFYLHKSNSTYFEELDISRTDLMAKIFQKLFTTSKRYPYVPVANVFTNFLKEIKPYQPYEVKSCIFCWDEKWIYVMSRFYIEKGSRLASLSLTKYVLKDGRKTITPRDALEICGLYNKDVEKISQENYKILSEQCGFQETRPLENIKHEYSSI
ncbi:LAFE_0G16556g1_1 [Lachancea fermentati]|uniref:LAFE_0G16556g1_1 n=1 Tax=Lachancea fermentati TaxID=4955 RepID=A0A1G4MIU9_LACFM|nr:LAFE_0G16556g1_1 [Lachancea fermentati]